MRWLYISGLLWGGLFGIAGAQNIERQVVSPAGGSSAASSVSVSWSAGEVATERYEHSDVILTQGFQQPYAPIGLIRTESFSGNPGDTREMNILLDQHGILPFAPASAISVKLRFNATLLEPVAITSAGTIIGDTMAEGRRTVQLLLPVEPVAQMTRVLGTLQFRVGLGNDSTTALELLDATPVGGAFRLRTASGAFKLLGICYQGGPRLVNPVERITILLRPNPVISVGELEFDLYHDERVRIIAIDLLGRTVLPIADDQMKAGHYVLSFDAGAIPAGSYTIVLETPTRRFSRPMVVQR